MGADPSVTDLQNTFNSEQFDALKGVLAKKGRVVFNIASGSMVPVLPIGAKIVVEPVAPEKLERFDIVVFWNQRFLIGHYFWERSVVWGPAAGPESGEQFVMRSLAGDFDVPVPATAILGKVVSHRVSRWWRFKIVLAALWT